MNKKKHTLLLPLLFFTSVSIASEEPDDEINTKTPNDASKIIPGSENREKRVNENNLTCRIGRKRRRQSTYSEHNKVINHSQIVHKKR